MRQVWVVNSMKWCDVVGVARTEMGAEALVEGACNDLRLLKREERVTDGVIVWVCGKQVFRAVRVSVTEA